MDSSESNTNQSVMTFGNKSSESGEHSSDRPCALPANVADASMSSETDPSEQQEFGSSVVVPSRGRPRDVSIRKRDLRPANPKGRNRTPRSVTPPVRHRPSTADEELDELIHAGPSAAARKPHRNIKLQSRPPVVSSPRASTGKSPVINKSVGKPKPSTGSIPPGGKIPYPATELQNAC